jgi:hypothetical protein
MKLVFPVVGLSVVSGFPIFDLFKKNRETKSQPQLDDVDFNQIFAKMDQALNRAFAIPVLEAIPVFETDVYHMPNGQEFMSPLRQLGGGRMLGQQNGILESVFGFPQMVKTPMSNPMTDALSNSMFSKSSRFLKLGDTDDQEEKSHDEVQHATTTKHKTVQNLMDRLTGKSGLKTTKTTDIVSDDGHSQVHMIVSSFGMDENDNIVENNDVGYHADNGYDAKEFTDSYDESMEAKKIFNGEGKKYSVEAEKIFNGEVRPGKSFGFSDEDLKEREFQRQKYVDNMINKWSVLLNGPFGFPGSEKAEGELSDLESILSEKKELEEKLKKLNLDEKIVREKLIDREVEQIEAEKVDQKVEDKEAGQVAKIEVIPDDDHVTFKSSKELEDETEDVEAEKAQEIKVEPEAETVQKSTVEAKETEEPEVIQKIEKIIEPEVVVEIEPVKSLKSLKKKVAKHAKKKHGQKHKNH